MNKILIRNKDGCSYIDVKLQNGQALNSREIEVITSGNVDGLLPVTIEEQGKSIILHLYCFQFDTT